MHIGLRIYFLVDGVPGGTGDVTQAQALRGNSATMWGPHGAGAGISFSWEKLVFFLSRKAVSKDPLSFLRHCSQPWQSNLQDATSGVKAGVPFPLWWAS